MNEMAAESQAQTPVAGKQFRRGLHGALRLALDLALPPLCPSYREPLGDGIGLRAGCWSKLSFIEPPYCARLGIPFLYDPGPGLLLMEAIDNPPAYDRARAAVRYDDVARAPVISYKYSDRMDLAPLTGHWMARAGAELLTDADARVPVPLHWRRLWARRFNQSAALAGGISAASGVSVMHSALKRVAPRRSRWACRKPTGRTMCRAPFVCRRRKKTNVAGRRLVLNDDVLTSGATVDTCARALLRAGAAHVDALVFARVVSPARTPI